MSRPKFKDDISLSCEECGEDICAGENYFVYKGMIFCSKDCIGSYVTSQEAIEQYLRTAEDKELEYGDLLYEERI